MSVVPAAPLHTVRNNDDQLIITIPSLRRWPAIIVSGMWFTMWLVVATGSVAGAFASNPADRYELLSSTCWLVLVFIFGATITYIFAWQILGREEIYVTDHSIKISQVVIGLRTQKEYSIDHVKDLRTSPAGSSFGDPATLLPFIKNRSGVIAFDYGAKTYKFGSGIDEAEAKQIIAEIQQKFPQYKN